MRKFVAWTAAACFAGALMAQDVVTAKAGLVHYIEGDVTLDSAMLSTKPGKFAEMKKGSVLKTLEGRAEVLLAPGSSVRLSDNSALQMKATSLEDTRFKITAGSAMVEVGDLEKFMSIVVAMGDTEVTLRKKGLYHFDAEPPSFKVFEGEASVSDDGKSTVVGRGRVAAINENGEVLVAKFDAKDGDELYRWAKRRSYSMAMANLSAANSVHTQGVSFIPGMMGMGMGMGSGMGMGGWMYNPYFGMYTYIPLRGMYQSPWGFGYYTPRLAYNYISYANSPQAYQGGGSNAAYNGFGGTGRMNTTFDSNLGYSTSPMRSSGGYTGGTSSPAATGGDSGMRGGGGGAATPAPSAGGDGGARGGGGGTGATRGQ